MACASESNVNSIKVKIIGEDFRDLLIDWTVTRYECGAKQVFRQLSEITGIPIEHTSEFYLWKLVNQQVTVAIPAFNDGHGRRSNFRKNSVMNVLKEGDEFYLATYLRCQPNRRLSIGYMLIDLNLTEETKCTRHFCLHSHTRSIIDRERKLITDETLMATLSQRLDITGEIYQWNTIFRELNILQYLEMHCSCAPSTDTPLLYVRQNG